MFSVSQPQNRGAAPKNNRIMQAPRGFAVRVFKGPTLSSFPYTATAKFDAGYRPTGNNDPRQSQNWYPSRVGSTGPPLSNSREPPKPSRFGSWTENRSRDTANRAVPASNYADFIYERSLSSKSDILSNSDNDTSSTTTFTPSSMFSPALSADSTVTSAPSQVPYQSPTTTTSTITASSPPPRHPFPLHIPALAQAQSAIRGLFVHPNGDIGQQRTSPVPVPAAPVSRPAALPQMAVSPPRLSPTAAPARPTSPLRVPFSESPQSGSFITATEYFPPPASESEVGEAQRLAERNAAQYNSASSAYYQAGFQGTPRRDDGAYGNTQHESAHGRDQSPERAAQLGSSSRSVASSSFPTESSDSQVRVIYESSSIVTDPATFMNMPMSMPTVPPPPRVSPTMSQPRVAFVPSEASSTTVVDSEPRWRDSYASNTRNVPVSQLVQLDDHHPDDDTGAREAGRARVLSDPGRYEELRGLNMMGDRQREAYVNAFAPGTQPRILQWPMLPEIPAVVRSDSDSSSRGVPPPERARRTSSGNLWSSLPQLPSQRSSPQAQPRPPSTPPLPRLDTSRLSAPIPPPEPRSVENQARQQSPPRRDTSAVQQPPSTAPPVSSNRSRTPLAGPRVLPAEPQRRRSDGDQPMNASPSLLKRTSAIFHKGRTSPEPAAPRPTRPGALPLDPQRRRSDGFQSVVPPRPTTPGPSNAVPRNVRWNENLVCPSPVFANQRRKGWFNRRGDQLWTNDGAYKPPPAGQEFPPDLRDYPVYGSGWMNEEGVRIDMGHRLIPKAPLRSALKQTQVRGPVIQVDHGN